MNFFILCLLEYFLRCYHVEIETVKRDISIDYLSKNGIRRMKNENKAKYSNGKFLFSIC